MSLPILSNTVDGPSELSVSDTSLVLVMAVLKLLKMATGMRALLDTVVQALPQVKQTSFSFPAPLCQRADSHRVSEVVSTVLCRQLPEGDVHIFMSFMGV